MSKTATAPRNARTQAPPKDEQPEVAERPAPELTIDLPLVTTTVRAPQFAAPAVDAVAGTVREYIPSRKTALFYAGLAGTAAFGLISWPVAVAVGIGTALAQQPRDAAQQH